MCVCVTSNTHGTHGAHGHTDRYSTHSSDLSRTPALEQYISKSPRRYVEPCYSSPARCGETHDIEPEDLQEMARITLQDVTLEQVGCLIASDRLSSPLIASDDL